MTGFDGDLISKQQEKRRRVHRMKTGIASVLFIWLLLVSVLNVFLLWKVFSLQKDVDSLKAGHPETKTAEAASEDPVSSTGSLVAGNTGTGEENLRDPDDILKVYLTFDDGPSDNSDRILDILDDYGIKATFFVNGREDPHSLKVYQRIVEEGHTIGMHSYSHDYEKVYASLDAFISDYDRIHDLILKTTGVDSHLYRFPGGSSNQVSPTDMSLFITFLNERGISYLDWNVSSEDATSAEYTADDLIENVMNDVIKYKTSVVLLHDADDKGKTVDALPGMIEALQAAGAVILPVSDDTQLIQHVTVAE